MASVAFLEGYHYVPRIDKELLAAHKRGHHLPERLRLRRVQRVHPQGPARRGDRSWPQWFAKRLRQGLLRRDPEQRPGHPEAAAPRAPSTSPTGSACRWWPPATPTTCCQADSRRPRRAAVHQHRQDCATTPNRMRYGSDQFYVRAAGGDVRALPRPRRRGAAQPGDRRRLRTSSSTSRHGTSPSSRRPAGKTPEDYLRELCEHGLRERYGDNAAAGRARPARARAGHHLPHGLRQLLPDRLGLRALRRRERHPGQRPRLGLRRRSSATS